jgi:hypothetical protein
MARRVTATPGAIGRGWQTAAPRAWTPVRERGPGTRQIWILLGAGASRFASPSLMRFTGQAWTMVRNGVDSGEEALSTNQRLRQVIPWSLVSKLVEESIISPSSRLTRVHSDRIPGLWQGFSS